MLYETLVKEAQILTETEKLDLLSVILESLKNAEKSEQKNPHSAGHPVLGLGKGKLPKLTDINLLDKEVAADFKDFA